MNPYFSRSTDAGNTSSTPLFVAAAEAGQGGLGATSDMTPHSVVASSSTGKANIITSEIFYDPLGVNTNMEITFRTAG